MYNDFVTDPRQFEKNNVLYYHPINDDKLIIGKPCFDCLWMFGLDMRLSFWPV